MQILLLNAGSSSLKATLFEAGIQKEIASAYADWAGATVQYHFVGSDGIDQNEEVTWRSHSDAMRRIGHDLLQCEHGTQPLLHNLQAIGHRVVHGGAFTTAVRITPEVISQIEALVELAPLHNPPSLNVMAAAKTLFPDVPHIATFDTAFHATMPPEAYTYAIPSHWTNEWGIRRYGFHGLSHAYCSQRAALLLNRPIGSLRIIVCHLGHGCSAAAIVNGRCVETTMGFTPLEGLMMATRSGSIDPSILSYVQQHHGLTSTEIDTVLNRESGLSGVSGISADMREILAALHDGHHSAKLAFEMYTRKARQYIGALAVTMKGVDALVFTAGVGEHSHEVRAAVCNGLDCLGLDLDANANVQCEPDRDIATATSLGRILVIATHEEQSMLTEVLQVIHQD